MSNSFAGSANKKKVKEIYHVKVLNLPQDAEELEKIMNNIRQDSWYYVKKDYFSDKLGMILCHIEWVEEVWETISPIIN